MRGGKKPSDSLVASQLYILIGKLAHNPDERVEPEATAGKREEKLEEGIPPVDVCQLMLNDMELVMFGKACSADRQENNGKNESIGDRALQIVGPEQPSACRSGLQSTGGPKGRFIGKQAQESFGANQNKTSALQFEFLGACADVPIVDWADCRMRTNPALMVYKVDDQSEKYTRRPDSKHGMSNWRGEPRCS